jgi:glutamine synthetase
MTTVVDLLGTGPGRAGFIEEHGLWDDAEYAAAAQALRVIDEHGIELIRVAFSDHHGLLRGKTLTREVFESALRHGVRAPSSLVLKDTSGRSVYPVFDAQGTPAAELANASDLVLVPLPTTFRILSWVPRTAWVLCDIQLADGRPVPFSCRHVLKGLLARLAAERDLSLTVGVEIEFHVFGPGLEKLTPSQQLLSETSVDAVDDVVQILRDGLHALDLGLSSIEVEFGTSQLELTFAPHEALRAADDTVLCRSAVKQLCKRHGYHATFMARPHVPEVASSGWHLHQCLVDTETGENRFMAEAASQQPMSELARSYLGGLLSHAAAASVFTTPTINGYKRYRPLSLAPDRVLWGEDNKGAMVRAVGGPGDPRTRLENRSGEPAANPYLYFASQLVSGLDGIDHGLEPGDPTMRPYGDVAPRLPASLMDAIAALRSDTAFSEHLGADFVDHAIAIKESEIARFLSSVTDWEQAEYFDLF